MILTKNKIIREVKSSLMHAATHLEEGLEERLEQMEMRTKALLMALGPEDRKRPSYEASLEVLGMIRKNLDLSGVSGLPMCQDTGMVLFFVEMGNDISLSMHEIEGALHDALEQAVVEGNFRNSVVDEPVFDRINTGTNLPPVIHWFTKSGPGLTIRAMLKGFGSENCSAMQMLNPTAGPEKVLETVLRMVKEAGGKPCPPIVVGIGLGGTAERSGQLAKKALFRPVGEPHPDRRYAELERQIEDAIQALQIGPGGFGGPLTALGVSVEQEPTHIAGLPLSVAISCWADRKALVEIGGDSDA